MATATGRQTMAANVVDVRAASSVVAGVTLAHAQRDIAPFHSMRFRAAPQHRTTYAALACCKRAGVAVRPVVLFVVIVRFKTVHKHSWLPRSAFATVCLRSNVPITRVPLVTVALPVLPG